MHIEITISKDTPSNQWLKSANKQARAIAAYEGVDWKDCEVFVRLPENGRCFVKYAGYLNFSAHG